MSVALLPQMALRLTVAATTEGSRHQSAVQLAPPPASELLPLPFELPLVLPLPFVLPPPLAFPLPPLVLPLLVLPLPPLVLPLPPALPPLAPVLPLPVVLPLPLPLGAPTPEPPPVPEPLLLAPALPAPASPPFSVCEPLPPHAAATHPMVTRIAARCAVLPRRRAPAGEPAASPRVRPSSLDRKAIIVAILGTPVSVECAQFSAITHLVT